MQDVAEMIKRIEAYIKKALGIGEIQYLAPGDSASRVYKVQAEGGALTYDLTTSEGEDITGASLGQDQTITGEFDSVSVDGGSTGSAIVWKF